MRNVSPLCMMRAMWHIMLILCRVGWRLKSTPSPSIMWRCTMSPLYSTMLSRSAYRSEMFSPPLRSRIFAPGYSSGPLRTSLVSMRRFMSFTTTGFVMFFAILRGTPSSLMERLGSGVMTDRAEKSTRLPMRLPRTRPPLPFRRSLMDLSGRPERWATGAAPGMLLSTSVAQ